MFMFLLQPAHPRLDPLPETYPAGKIRDGSRSPRCLERPRPFAHPPISPVRRSCRARWLLASFSRPFGLSPPSPGFFGRTRFLPPDELGPSSPVRYRQSYLHTGLFLVSSPATQPHHDVLAGTVAPVSQCIILCKPHHSARSPCVLAALFEHP